MRFIHFVVVFFLSFSLISPPNAQAYWIWSPAEGKFVKPENAGTEPKKSADELYEYALKLRESDKSKDNTEAINELKNLIRQYPESAYAPEAQYLLATMLEEREKPVQAAAEYQKLIRDFPRSERIDEATERLFNLGKFFLTGEKQKVMGLSIIPVLPKAVEVFQFIIEQVPYGPFGDQAQLNLAAAYRKMGRFEEAIQSLETLISNYPTSTLIDEAHYQLAETSYELSQNAIRDQKSRNQASDYLKDFLKQYGSSSLAERAKILKAQLDEQDAEKNYRIGLYYEKEGFIESALIYYEDVANRYAHTAFGKKAAERYQAVNEPALVMAKGQAAVDRRVAEVQSMLQALDQEEKKRKDSKMAPVSDTADLRKQLESELTTLKLAQREFKEESKEKFLSRKGAFRDRERNLRRKFKIFNKRKKSMRNNEAPELQLVFQRWEASLLREQEELAREREILGQLGAGFKAKAVSSSWFPYFAGIGGASSGQWVRFDDKKWSKLEQSRAELKRARETYQTELAVLAHEIAKLEEQEFEMVSSVPGFEGFLTEDLNREKQNLAAMQTEVSNLRQVFQDRKNNYERQYGAGFLKTLEARETSPDSAKFVQNLVAGGADLENELEDLQNRKAALSQNWLALKEQINTLAKALGESASSTPTPEALEVPAGEEQAKEARMLKKRIKFLEREIRSRIDQILDWERENAKRMDKLNQLLHSEDSSVKMNGTAGKVLSPVSGSYKLFKAFLFGLPNHDRELLEEARQKLAAAGGLSPERQEAVRELEEEIALQSVLIQGRANEVTEMEKQLKGLQEQAKQLPGFEYQSMLINRFPFALSHSIESARELLGGKNRETVLTERLNRQTAQLQQLEKEIVEVNQKIAQVTSVLQKMQKPDPVAQTAASILESLPGGTESLPSSDSSSAPADESRRQELETELLNLRDQLVQAELEYQETSLDFQKNMLSWYRAEGRGKIGVSLPSEARVVADRITGLNERRTKLQNSLASTAGKEYQAVQSQIRLLDQKLKELEKRIARLNDSEAGVREALDAESKQTGVLRESLTREVSLLENLIKR